MKPEKLLPALPSMADLMRYLAARRLLPDELVPLIRGTEARLKKSRLTQVDWKSALKTLQRTLEQATPDLALALLASREYRRIASACDAPAAYSAALGKVLVRYPQVQQEFEIIRLMHRTATARADGEPARARYRAELMHLEGLVQHPAIAASVTLKDLLALLRSWIAESDAAHGWDWTDANWYAARDLPFPWMASQSAGVDLSTDQCLSTNGWELFIRRITNTDGLTLPVDFPEAVSGTQKFFALYNNSTGVLRVFVLFSAGGAPGADRLVTKNYISSGGAGTPFPTHGLFNHIGPRSHCGDDVLTFTDNVIVTYSSQVTVGWIVIDLPLAYAPLPDRDETPYYLNNYINAENASQLSVQGKVSVQVPITSPAPTFFSRLRSLLGGVAHLSDSGGDVEKAGKKIQAVGDQMTAGGGSGALLSTLGAALMATAGPVGVVLAGTQILQTFLSFFSGGGGVKFTTYEGTLNLVGELRDEWFRAYSAILLEDSDAAVAENTPYYFKLHPSRSLGVFRLSSLPLVRLTCIEGTFHQAGLGRTSTHYLVKITVQSPIEHLVVVNRSSDVTLESVTVQVVLQKPWMDPQDGEGMYVLGPGVKAERDPADPSLLNIFVPQFEPAAAYADRTLIAHGICLYPSSYGDARTSKVRSVLLRMRYVFLLGGPNLGKTSELIMTYKCDPIWVGGQDNGLEANLPWWPN